jgi:hypothetical protein
MLWLSLRIVSPNPWLPASRPGGSVCLGGLVEQALEAAEFLELIAATVKLRRTVL